MSKSRDLGEFPAAALDIDASGNLDVTGTVTADELLVSAAGGTLVNLTATDAGTPQNIIKFNDTGGTTAFVGSRKLRKRPLLYSKLNGSGSYSS